MGELEIAEVIPLLHISNATNVTSDPESLLDLELLASDGGKALVILVGMLMAGFLIGHCLHVKNVSWLPESLIIVLLGAVVGVALPSGNTSITGWAVKRITIQEESIVNEIVLSWFLLPMIIFEAGWSLQHRNFMSQFPYILLFAIFGTLISMAVVTSLILATSGYHGVHQPRVAAAYAALISAVDPVATLATYNHLNVDPLLNTMVFGESVINDAVAIVLFKTLNDMPPGAFDDMSVTELSGTLAGGVCVLLGCSLGLGLVLACLYCLIFRFTNLGSSKALSALFILFSSFFTYNLTESIFGMSGIIAVLFCGMLMGGYVTPHLSVEGTMFTSFLLKQMAFIGDMIVFLFVGIAVVYVSHNGFTFGLWVMAFCLVGRAVATLPLAMLTNCIKSTVLRKRPKEKRHLLSWQHIFMMWHAGLRGGIALVLTLELGDWVDEINGPHTKESLRNATIIVICAFLLVFGGTTEAFLKLLGIPLRGEGFLEHHPGNIMQIFSKLDAITTTILVGNHEPEDIEPTTPVVSSLLSDARHFEAGEIGRRASNSTSEACERYDLFGTYDPTHSLEVGAARTRRARITSTPELIEVHEDEVDQAEGDSDQDDATDSDSEGEDSRSESGGDAKGGA